MKIFIGYDPREHDAWKVAEYSIEKHATSAHMEIKPIRERTLRAGGVYTRETVTKGNQRYDVISDAPCSTEFSIARFFLPVVAGKEGWAMFVDCDFLFRADVSELFDAVDPTKAVMCVKHVHLPKFDRKMDNQKQTHYSRKNWSSLFLFNLEHPSNKRLNPWLLNNMPGWALHNFCWLADSEIGALDPAWNWIQGVSSEDIEPKAVHYSEVAPWFGHDCKYGDEWKKALEAVKLEDR